MIIFTDVISNDEMISDAFPMKEIDGVVYEIDCAMVKVGSGVDVDIGANPSAEDAPAEDMDDTVQTVNNVVNTFRLESTPFDKKSYLLALKDYMKAVKAYLKEKNPDRVDAFEKAASAYAKKIVADFKNYEFYTGPSMDTTGMVALLNYREDGITPYLTVWKDGLKEVKC